MEIWKKIKDFLDYEVSNFGRVKSLKYGKERVLKFKERHTGHLLVNLYKNGKFKTKRIHILVYETFNNYKLKNDDNIHHKDENPKNNKLDNLELMTKSKHHSFHNMGVNNPFYGKQHSEKSKKMILEKNSKLKYEDVWMIKKILNSDCYKSGKINYEYIGKMFNISLAEISRIKTGKRWNQIKYENS